MLTEQYILSGRKKKPSINQQIYDHVVTIRSTLTLCPGGGRTLAMDGDIIMMWLPQVKPPVSVGLYQHKEENVRAPVKVDRNLSDQ